MSLAEDQKVVVKAINRVRAKAGLGRINKLRRGVPKHARACPVAMSLAGTGITHVGAILWKQNDSEVRTWAHLGFTNDEIGAIARVVMAIDDGKLPELEIPKTPVKIKYPGDRAATVIK